MSVQQDLTNRLRFTADAFYSMRDTVARDSGYTITAGEYLTTADDPFGVPGVPLLVFSSGDSEFAATSNDAALIRTHSDRERYQLSAGLEAEMWGDWLGRLNATLTEDRSDTLLSQQAVISPLAPLPQGFDPFSVGQTQQAHNQLIVGFPELYSSSTADSIAWSMDGSLFAMAGGTARLAAGAEYRMEASDSHLQGGPSLTFSRRDVSALYK